jgi:hypothetical protein
MRKVEETAMPQRRLEVNEVGRGQNLSGKIFGARWRGQVIFMMMQVVEPVA